MTGDGPEAVRSLTCDEAEELIPAYVVGELAPERRTRLRRHLDGCLSCTAWLAECEASRELWRQVEAGTAPAFVQATVPSPDFVDAVMARIGAESPAPTTADSEPGQPGRRAAVSRSTAVPPRKALVHFALAASLSLLLLQSGFFDEWVNLAADQWPKTVVAGVQGLLSHTGGPPAGGFMGGFR